MRDKKKKPVYLPLSHALTWIVASTLILSGVSHALIKQYFKRRSHRVNDVVLRSIVQTGPQKEALKTGYLAELLGISSNRPCFAKSFDLQSAKQRLLLSPLISRADVKLIDADTLYVDYTVRQPMAWLEDYNNVVVDREGYPFPFSPFFTPKNLPALYLGLSPFGVSSADPDRPTAHWGASLQGKYFALALDILCIVTEPQVADLFSVKRIDVSNAFAESYGTREIVVMTEDTLFQQFQGHEVQLILPRILRLSTKHYAQELGNYLKLRQQLLEEERKISSLPEHVGSSIHLKEKIIDFRIQKLAFIEEQSKTKI